MKWSCILIFGLIFIVPGQLHTQILTPNSSEILQVDLAGILNLPEVLAEAKRQKWVSADDAFLSVRQTISPTGGKHQRFIQRHQGLRVIGGEAVVHFSENTGAYLTGNLQFVEEVDLHPWISESQILAQAGLYIEGIITEFDTPELVIIDTGFPYTSGKYTIAYELNLQTSKPSDRLRLFVDAHSGRVLDKQSRIQHARVVGTAQSEQYGAIDFYADSLDVNQYVLRDPIRGNATYYNERIEPNLINAPSSNFDDELHSIAVDIHYAAEQFYDMLEDRYGWRGVDGLGKPMESIVMNIDGAFNARNAFWNGETSTFGRGNCLGNGFTEADIVGHEFAHGISEFTSDIYYDDLGQAIQEAFSDIMGKCLEHRIKPNDWTWEVGRNYETGEGAIRIMNDPLRSGGAAAYLGQNWNGAIASYEQSAVYSYWFTMLVEGAIGTNEFGLNYNVPAIGWDKAMDIVFITARDYLVSSSGFIDLYRTTQLATEELFGANSSELASVKEAWRAVNIDLEDPWASGGDISIVRFDPASLVCVDGSGFNFRLLIGNYKNSTISTNEDISVLVELASENRGVWRAKPPVDIAYGEQVWVDFETDVQLPAHSFNKLITVSLIGSDEIAANSRARYYANTATAGEFDVEVRILRAQEVVCGSTMYNGTLEAFNRSCDDIPANTLSLVYFDQDSIEITRTPLDHPLIPSEQLRYVSLELQRDSLQPFHFLAIDFDAEQYPESNGAQIAEGLFPPVIEEPFTLKLDKLEAFDTLQLFERSIDSINVFEYEGEKYWMSFSYFDFFNGTSPFCSPEAAFNARREFTEATTCVDFTGYENLALDYGIVQFRKPTYEDQLGAAAFEVAYRDNGAWVTDLQAGLPRGELQQVSIALPDEYRGPVRVRSRLAEGFPDDPFSVDNSSRNLIDQLSFRGDTIETIISQVTDLVNSARIWPNPVNEFLQLEVEDEKAQQIQISDALGRLVYKSVLPQNKQIDMRNLTPGIYILSYSLRSGESGSVRFIKER